MIKKLRRLIFGAGLPPGRRMETRCKNLLYGLHGFTTDLYPEDQRLSEGIQEVGGGHAGGISRELDFLSNNEKIMETQWIILIFSIQT
jgi:hypothetical protein